MKTNPDKFQFIILGNTGLDTMQIGDLTCSMIESQFSYCPLIWMLCLKIDMQRVEKVQ